MSSKSVRRFCSNEVDGHKALREVAEKTQAQEGALSLLFISNTYNLDQLNKTLKENFGSQVVACTTAGEITDEGFGENTISGITFSKGHFEASLLDVADLNEFSDSKVKEIKEELVAALENHHNKISNGKSFALLFIDGLSMREEKVTSTLSYILPGDIPLVGGSAGDGLDFLKTEIFTEGEFKSNRATLVLVTTSVPFKVFKSQHFSASDKKMVITEADPDQRLVKEIDGEPAAEAYSRHLGVDLKDFDHHVYSQNPVILKMGDEDYIRSIQRVNEDKSLTLYCAIEEGIVLSLAERGSIVDSVEGLFDDLSKDLDGVSSCLLFECILRRLEVLNLPEDQKKRVFDVYKMNNACGFHTYGEQYGGTHINQTITGIAFGNES